MSVDPSTLWVFALASLALAVVPGPAVLYIVAQSVHHGRATGVVSALGIATGGLVHVLAAVIGLSAVLATSAAAFTVVKLLGAGHGRKALIAEVLAGELGRHLGLPVPDLVDATAISGPACV